MSDDLDFVYIIATVVDGEMRGPVKVGITKSPASRLASIRTASPNKVDLYLAVPVPGRVHAADIERGFHEVKAKRRLNGEWFDMSPREAHMALLINVGMYLNRRIGLEPEEVNEILREIGLAP